MIRFATPPESDPTSPNFDIDPPRYLRPGLPDTL
jgi:hypothetical protein